MRRALVGLFSLLIPATAQAADFHVDPATGSMSNDGSSAHPWSTLADVIAAKKIATQDWDAHPYKDGAKLVARDAKGVVKAGDTIWLHSGYHGDASLLGYYNASDITVAAVSGQTPRLGRIQVAGGQNWVFRGLSVSPSHSPAYSAAKPIVSLSTNSYQGPTHDITVEDCAIESVPDTSKWTGEQWLTLPAYGIQLYGGSHHTIRRNRLRNVSFGIWVSATDSLIERNVVDGFGNGDGMDGIGDDCVFQYNTIKNAHHPDPDPQKGNHDDGFQSWSTNGVPVKNIVVRGNVFINDVQLDEPFLSHMQGVGAFDGPYEGFVIENNVVISDTLNGITLWDAHDCRIVNNTVINRVEGDKPWIQIYDGKSGGVSSGNVVRNNLTFAMNVLSKGVVSDHNLVVQGPKEAASFFVSPATFDLHLLPGAALAIDQGASDLAPALDIEGTARPQGKAVDLGAYEWHAAGTGGVGGSGGSGQSGAAGSGAAGVGGAGGGGAGAGAGGASAGGPAAGGAGAAGESAGGSGGGDVGGSGGAGLSGSSGHGGASGAVGGVSGAAGGGSLAGQGGQAAGASGSSGHAGRPAGAGQAGGGSDGEPDAGSDGGCSVEVAGATRPAAAVGVGLVLLGLVAARRRSPRVRRPG